MLETKTPSSLQELVHSISIHVTGANKFSKFKHLYENDRIAFVYDCLPALARTIAFYQEEILGYFDDGYNRVAVRGPHGLGKTTLAAVMTHHTVLTADDDCKVPTTATAWRQLEKYLWPEIKKVAKFIDWERVGREPYNQNELMSLNLKLNGGTVEAFAVASDDHNTIEGAHGRTLVYIFDEAKAIPRDTWDAAEGAFSNAELGRADRKVNKVGNVENLSDRELGKVVIGKDGLVIPWNINDTEEDLDNVYFDEDSRSNNNNSDSSNGRKGDKGIDTAAHRGFGGIGVKAERLYGRSGIGESNGGGDSDSLNSGLLKIKEEIKEEIKEGDNSPPTTANRHTIAHTERTIAHGIATQLLLRQASKLPANIQSRTPLLGASELSLIPSNSLSAPSKLIVPSITVRVAGSGTKEISNNQFSTTFKALALAISTPGEPSGQFYDIHMHKVGYEDWKTRHVTVDEAIRAGRISESWVKQRGLQWGEDSSKYQNRVLGEFADNSEEGVIPLSWIRAAVERWKDWTIKGRKSQSGRRTIGVDTARMGEDKTVFAVRTGLAIENLFAYSKLSVTSTAGNLKSISDGRFLHIETDGGLGAAVYDILKQSGVPNLRPIKVSSPTIFRDRSKELSFINVRAAMWWNLRELLDPRYSQEVLLPDKDDLILDLSTPQWIMLSDAVVKLESKDSIYKRLGRSTDYGDAVCLAFWSTSSGGGVMV